MNLIDTGVVIETIRAKKYAAGYPIIKLEIAVIIASFNDLNITAKCVILNTCEIYCHVKS